MGWLWLDFCRQLEEVLGAAKTEESGATTKPPAVVQDYSAIRVDPNFDAEDVQALEPTPAGADVLGNDQESDSDDSSEDEEDTHSQSNGAADEAAVNSGAAEMAEEDGETSSSDDDSEAGAAEDDESESAPPPKKQKKSVSFLGLDPTADSSKKPKKRTRRGGQRNNPELASHAFLAPTRLKLEQIQQQGRWLQRKLDLIRAKQQKRKEKKLQAAAGSLPSGKRELTGKAVCESVIVLLLLI